MLRNLKTNEVMYVGATISVGEDYQGNSLYVKRALVWTGFEAIRIEVSHDSDYGCYADYETKIDATPEVLEAYKAWEHQQFRNMTARNRWEIRNYCRGLAKECGFKNYLPIHRLRKAITDGNEMGSVIRLLKTKNFRSNFRASIAQQVREWATTKKPKYSSPLSPKQRRCI